MARWAASAALAPIAAIVFILVSFVTLDHPLQWPDNVDNWTYWELSQNLLGDFYHVWTVRSYASDMTHSITYPPFYPFLIAIADRLCGWGPASGQVVNMAAIGLFAWLSGGIGQVTAGSRAAGLIVAAATLCFLPLSTEILGARTQPVALALTAAIARVLVSGRITPGRAFALGLLAGLGVLTRADAIATGVMLGVLVLAWSRQIWAGVAYGAGALSGSSPWAVHSLVRYQTIYANESRWSAGSRQPGLWSNDWVMPPGPPPMTGVADVLNKLYETIDVPMELAADVVRHTGPLLVVLGAAALIGWRFASRNPAVMPAETRLGGNVVAFRRLSALLLIWPPLVMGIWLADYPSVRYLSGAVWNIILLVTLAGSMRLGPSTRIALPVAALGLTILGTTLAWRHGRTVRFEPSARVLSRVHGLETCLRAAGAKPEERVLFARDEVQAAQFGSLVHWYSSALPHNAARLSVVEWAALLKYLDARFVAEPVSHVLFPLLGDETLRGCPLAVYRVLQP